MADEPRQLSIAATVEGRPRIKRVRIRNYRSIVTCDVNLKPLTVLVGRNGAGKSNFLDALRLVADGMQGPLDLPLRERGGIDAVRRRSGGHPNNFSIELEIGFPDQRSAVYHFEITAAKEGGFSVKGERLHLRDASGHVLAYYELRGGRVQTSEDNLPSVPKQNDRLFLMVASSVPAFTPVYELLRTMGFYNLNPVLMKETHPPSPGELLDREGANISSVIGRLSAEPGGAAMARVRAYLATIVPGIADVRRKVLGPVETLEFKQKVAGAKAPWVFFAQNMSDGTMRALGVLVAIMQHVNRAEPVMLVGIEEPETALHPAAARALVDALREASDQTQILLTTHSPDLLDSLDPEVEPLLSVQSEDGNTRIATIDRASREAVRERLYTLGELLRNDQLEPDLEDLERQQELPLFRSHKQAE